MKENEKILQVGNFLIEEVSEGGHQYIHINAVSGIWDIRYRDDNGMYRFVKYLTEEEELRDYLESFITALYTIMHCTPDLRFFNEYFTIYNELYERTLKRQDAPSKEDEKKTLEDMKVGVELAEAIKTEAGSEE